MYNLNDIINNGFLMYDQDRKLKSLALLSLHVALKSYFSTYQAMKYDIKRIIDNQSNMDEHYNSRYIELYAETIVHFQHFIELVCKDILRSEHELLATDAQKDPIVLYQLLKEEPIDNSILNKVRSIEFSETLKRLCTLINNKSIKDNEKLSFWVENKKLLEELNTLRNRIWHRGSYVLRYNALDCFMGTHILPMIVKIIDYFGFRKLQRYWKYTELACGLDPINLIIKEFATSYYTYDIGKIALIKELGRAAYQNPLPERKFTVKFDINSYESRANAELNNSNIAGVKKCPVCGINALLVYDDVEADECEPGIPENVYTYTWQVHCLCCSYEINYHLKNPKEYGIPLEDYWVGGKL